MKNLLALVGLVVVLVAGGGWYLGWYKLGSEPAGSGHRKINVDVNTNKISEDLKKGRETVGGFLDKNVEGVPASRPLDPNPIITLPSLPKLPEIPNAAPIELNPDGSLKSPAITITIPPPPPLFPGNK